MPRSRKQAVLLVDGYNVIGAWSALYDRERGDYTFQSGSREDLEIARDKLIEALINYSAYEDYDTKIVFDAYSQNNPAYSEVITPNLSIHYTDFLQTADTYIEKFCAGFRTDIRASVARLIVATSDRAQQLTVTGFGAEWMSAMQLIADVEASAKRSRRQHRPNKRATGRFLFHSLDPESQARLSALRNGLPPQSSK